MRTRLLLTAILHLILVTGYSQTYNPRRSTFFEATNYASNYLAVYDFNGDGLDDLLIGGSNGVDLNKTPIYLLISQGDGSFIEQTSVYINGELIAANPASINADYNNDGILDFAIFDKGHIERGQDPEYSGFYGEDAQLLLSNSTGTWDIGSVLADTHKEANDYDKSELHIKSGSSADINNDGFTDIFVESGGGSQQLGSHIYNNQGDKTFNIGKLEEQIWVYPFKGPNFLWRQQANNFADVNNDGFVDLLVGQLRRKDNGQEELTSYVLLNDGNGNFLEEGAISLPHPDWHEGYTYAKSILTLDLNQDGWMDLIYCQERGQDDMSSSDDAFSGNYMQVYINSNGSGFIDRTFDYMNLTDDILATTSEVYGINNNSGVAKLVDMNEDGFNDIFITQGPPVDKNNPLIFFNNGSNYFNPAPAEVYNSITGGQHWFGEASYPIDLNGDGLLDIISADLTPGPDGNYGSGDERDHIFPIIAVRNYPKVSSISVFSNEELVGGLDLNFVPDLGINYFYIEKIHGGNLFDSNQQLIEMGSFVERSLAESGFLFSPHMDFQGNAYFYIHGSTSPNTADLVGTKFIARIQVTCGGLEQPSVTESFTYCDGDEVLPIMINSSEENFVWYSNIQLTEILGEGKTFQPENISGTSTYYVTQKLTICESDATIVSVTINPKPQVEIDASVTSICAGETVTLTGLGAENYEWDHGVVNGEAFSPLETTLYEVIGYDSNDCSNTASLTVQVRAVPEKPSITREEDPLIKLISSSPDGNQWFLYDNAIEGATDKEYYPTEIGTHTVQVTENDCKSPFSDEIEIEKLILSTTGINDQLIFWPNPVDQTLHFNEAPTQFSEFIIYNSAGVIVRSGKLSDQVEVTGLASGVYFVQLSDRPGNSMTYRFIKN